MLQKPANQLILLPPKIVYREHILASVKCFKNHSFVFYLLFNVALNVSLVGLIFSYRRQNSLISKFFD